MRAVLGSLESLWLQYVTMLFVAAVSSLLALSSTVHPVAMYSRLLRLQSKLINSCVSANEIIASASLPALHALQVCAVTMLFLAAASYLQTAVQRNWNIVAANAIASVPACRGATQGLDRRTLVVAFCICKQGCLGAWPVSP